MNNLIYESETRLLKTLLVATVAFAIVLGAGERWTAKQAREQLDAEYIHNFGRDVPAWVGRMKCETPYFHDEGDYCVPRSLVERPPRAR